MPVADGFFEVSGEFLLAHTDEFLVQFRAVGDLVFREAVDCSCRSSFSRRSSV